MNLSRTPSPQFLTSDDFSPPSRLMPLTTKYYTPKSQRELRGWRTEVVSPNSGLQVTSQRPFVVKSKGQWTRQPRYPKERRGNETVKTKNTHRKTASEIVKVPLVPVLGDVLEVQEGRQGEERKGTYLPPLRRVDNHDSHHDHPAPSLPDLLFTTDPQTSFKPKPRPKHTHSMPSTLLRPSLPAFILSDRQIRFQSPLRISIGVEIDGSPYQERFLFERVVKTVYRPQRLLKPEKMDSEDREDYSGEIEELGGIDEEEESGVETVRESRGSQVETGEEVPASVSYHKYKTVIPRRSTTESLPKFHPLHLPSNPPAPDPSLHYPSSPPPTPSIDPSPPSPASIPPSQTPLFPSPDHIPPSQIAPTPSTDPVSPSIDLISSSIDSFPVSELSSSHSTDPQVVPIPDTSRSHMEIQGSEHTILTDLSDNSHSFDQKIEVVTESDEKNTEKSAKSTKNEAKIDTFKRKSLQKVKEAVKITGEASKFSVPSITVECASPLLELQGEINEENELISQSSDGEAVPLERRASIYEYYPEAIEEENVDEQSDPSSLSSRKTHLTGKITPVATSRRQSVFNTPSPEPNPGQFSRNSTGNLRSVIPRRSLTGGETLKRSISRVTDEESSSLSVEMQQEEGKTQVKRNSEVKKVEQKQGKSLQTGKVRSRRGSKVLVKGSAVRGKTEVGETGEEKERPPAELGKPGGNKGNSGVKVSALAGAISQSNRLVPAVDSVNKTPRRTSFDSQRKKQPRSRRSSDVFTFLEPESVSADEVFVRQFSFALMKFILSTDGPSLSQVAESTLSTVKAKVLDVGYRLGVPAKLKTQVSLLPTVHSDSSIQTPLSSIIKSKSSGVTPSKLTKSIKKTPIKSKIPLNQSYDDSDVSEPTPHHDALELTRSSSSAFELKHLSLLKNIATNLKISKEPPLFPPPPPVKKEEETESEREEYGPKPPLPIDLWFAGHTEDLEDDVESTLAALNQQIKPSELTAFTTQVTSHFKDLEAARTIDVMLATAKEEMDEKNYKECVERRKFMEYVKTLPEYLRLHLKDIAELRQIEQEGFVPVELTERFRHGFLKRKRKNQVLASRQGSEPALLYAKPTYTFTGLSTHSTTARATPLPPHTAHIGDVILTGGAHLVTDQNRYKERIYCRIKQEKDLDKFLLKRKRKNQSSISSVKSA